MISKSQEEYLKTIYIIQKQDNQPRVTDIAEKMNCTKASVNKSLKILTEQKLINYEPYGKIELTEDGIQLAKKTLEANDIVYLFLKEILGEEDGIAEEEAKEIKMVMRDITLNKLAKFVHCIDCARRNVET